MQGEVLERGFIHVVPRAGDSSCSVGTFAARISDPLRSVFNVPGAIVGAEVDTTTPSLNLIAGTVVGPNNFLAKVDSAIEELARLGAPEPTILLHYVGYGYQLRGVPFWLLSAMQTLRRRGFRIWVFFHELFATSRRPWKSAFFLAPFQMYLCRKLALLADRVFTSNLRYQSMLAGLYPGEVTIASICPNIGSPDFHSGTACLRQHAVVFSQSAIKRLLFTRYVSGLLSIKKALPQLSWIDIGGSPAPVAYPPELELDVKGYLDGRDVSAYLHQSRVGVIAYDCDLLRKSSVVSTLKAFGVVTICFCTKAGTHLHVAEPGVLFYDREHLPIEDDSLLATVSKSGQADYYSTQTPEACARQILVGSEHASPAAESLKSSLHHA